MSRAAQASESLEQIAAECHACRACPRLVQWREEAAADPPRRHAGEPYWARPIAGFGDRSARLVVVGLAPAAHGANRTGRIFTGDRSGDWLFAALHRAGLANQAEARRADDGLRLRDCFVTAVVRCPPPSNRPLPAERDRCLPFLERELAALHSARVLLCLGGFAWDGALRALRGLGFQTPRPRPPFGHGAEAQVGGLRLLGQYHPSQQNTFTGRLTEPMQDEVLERAVSLCEGAG